MTKIGRMAKFQNKLYPFLPNPEAQDKNWKRWILTKRPKVPPSFLGNRRNQQACMPSAREWHRACSFCGIRNRKLSMKEDKLAEISWGQLVAVDVSTASKDYSCSLKADLTFILQSFKTSARYFLDKGICLTGQEIAWSHDYNVSFCLRCRQIPMWNKF